MNTIEVGRVDRVVVHQRQVTDPQPSQQRSHGTARTAATDHADAQRPHDRIESFAEQCCLPSQKRRVFVPSILTPDLDLASDNGDR